VIDGKVLATGSSEDGDPLVEVWGVWIPRRADNVLFVVEVMANYFTDFAVDLFAKDYDDVGDGSSAGVGTTFSNRLGRSSFTKLGAKELVRVRLTLQRGQSLPETDIGLILFRFLEPIWFESVKG